MNEVARTTFLKGTHLISRGGEHTRAGRRWVGEAAALMRKIKLECDASKATEKDYDELVVFWSRCVPSGGHGGYQRYSQFFLCTSVPR